MDFDGILYIAWGISALELILFPIHPIVNAICLVLGAIIPGIFIGIGMPAFVDSVIGWVIVIILTLCGYICNIFMSGEDVMAEKTEDGKTFMVFTGFSTVAYAFSLIGTSIIAQGINDLFA